jgi:hypothetical protein
MHISFATLVAFALPFGITADRYIVSCGDRYKACSPSVLKDLEDAGATVIENFPFGVTVVEAGEDFDPAVSNVDIFLDLEVQLDQTEDVEVTLTEFAPLYEGNSSIDEQGSGRRLQEMKSPPFSEDDGKCSTNI